MVIRRILLSFTLILLTAIVLACSSTAHFQGTDLGATPAPDFQLTDQNGHNVALSSLRNRVVVLTFLYTRCPDYCPLIASKLSRVYDELGGSSRQVSFVAVSVAPEQDTPAAIAAFAKKNGMEGKWLYLNGARSQLQPVWNAYYIDVETPTPSSTVVGHSTRILLIDRTGRERVNLDADFAVDDMVQDLRTLLNA